MVQIDITYRGGLRCEAVHGPSGQTLVTDAPVDNHGKGESFSPTDLVATALGVCIPTIMGIVAEREKIDLSDMRITVVKEMSVGPPRRIAKLTTRISCRADWTRDKGPSWRSPHSRARCIRPCTATWRCPSSSCIAKVRVARDPASDSRTGARGGPTTVRQRPSCYDWSPNHWLCAGNPGVRIGCKA